VSRRAPLVLLALSCLVWGGLPAGGQAVDTSRRQALEADITRYQQQLDARQAEIDRITKELGDTAADLKAKVAERDRVSQELNDLRAQQATLQDELASLEQQRDQTEARIDDLNGRLDALKDRIRALLLNLYKQRATRFASTLARSQTFHDFQVDQHYLSLLADQDVAVVTQLDTLLADLRTAQQQLAEELAALQAKQQELEANASAREARRAELESVIQDLEATRKGQLAQKQSLLEEQNKLNQQLGNLNQQLEAEINRLRQAEAEARSAAERYAQDREQQLRYQQQADQARARLDALTAPTPLSTGFIMPLEQGTIVSRFGEGNNSYIAIRASVGNAAVRAAQAGKVVAITYLGANFGYMAAVQHGGGLTTVYTNLRKPVVEVFDTVEQGTVLGYLGGGTLSDDLLPFYARSETASGKSVFVDPTPLLGQ
jgi:septal ring factor EnvC (AmiA/AmiB activator)